MDNSTHEMSFGIPFQCARTHQPVDNVSTDLCLASSICLLHGDGKQECIRCAPGWIDSNVRGHFPNCGTPEVFYPIFFGVHLATTIIGVFLIVRKLRYEVKSAVLKSFGKSIIVYMLSEALYVFLLFLEQGNFVGTTICLILCCVVGSEALIRYTNLMIHTSMPLLKSQERKCIQRTWRLYQVLIIILLLVLGILTAIYSNGDAEEYNVFFYSYTQIIFLETFCITVPAIYLAHKIIRELMRIKNGSESAQQKKLESLIEKLRLSRISFFYAGFAFTLFVQTEFFLYLVLGSVPYEFIFSIFFNVNFSFPGILILLRNEDRFQEQIQDAHPSLTNTARKSILEVLLSPRWFLGARRSFFYMLNKSELS